MHEQHPVVIASGGLLHKKIASSIKSQAIKQLDLVKIDTVTVTGVPKIPGITSNKILDRT